MTLRTWCGSEVEADRWQLVLAGWLRLVGAPVSLHVRNETCLFGGAAPVLAWSLHEPTARRPSRRMCLAVSALRRLGAEVGDPTHARPVWADRSCDEWMAGVRIHAAPGSSLALSVGGLLKRLDREAWDGSARSPAGG